MIRALASLFVALSACAPPGDAVRTAWLHSTLVADNRLIFERFPDEAAGKLALMASDPFAFLRGTVGQYVRDVLEPGPYHRPTRFGSAAASRRLLLGDAHLENVGTFFAGRVRLLIDFNDFDAATYGPYHLDVWRLCASIDVALAGAAPGLRVRWMRAAARGYAEHITHLAGGGAPDLADRPAEVVLADLIRRAQRDGEEDVMRQAYTRLVGERRVPFLGDVEPPAAHYVVDRVVPVSPAEAAAVEAALATWRETLVNSSVVSESSTAIKGLSRRLGAGVSSYPLPRYYVLLEGPTTGPVDDLLIELKEAADPVPLPGVDQHPWPREASNADRVVRRQRSLQAFLDDDPWLGVARLEPRSFRVRAREGYQKNLSVDRLREKFGAGEWTAADLEAAFAAIGRILARAHGGAPGADGQPGAPVIAAALGGQVDAFSEEAAAFGAAYGEAIRQDYQRFVALLAAEGPLLGYREVR